MARYKVDLIEPGTTSSKFSEGVGFSEKQLREAVTNIEGTAVKNCGKIIGEVVDVYYYDDGVKCVVEIIDEDVISSLDDGLGKIAPVMIYNVDEEGSEVRFRSLNAVAQSDPLVGDVERVESEWLYGWEE